MILLNIATKANLANGSCGIITDIFLDPREVIEGDNPPVVYLKYPPSAVLFAPSNRLNMTLPNLPRGIVPVFPTHTTYNLVGATKTTVDRHQLALTAGYAFTDIKSQGQTMECVVIDLGKPPSGSLTAFNAYVALSRSHGRDTIRLLRDFEERLFTVHPSEELRHEDARLSLLEEKTMTQYEAGEFGEFVSQTTHSSN